MCWNFVWYIWCIGSHSTVTKQGPRNSINVEVVWQVCVCADVYVSVIALRTNSYDSNNNNNNKIHLYSFSHYFCYVWTKNSIHQCRNDLSNIQFLFSISFVLFLFVQKWMMNIRRMKYEVKSRKYKRMNYFSFSSKHNEIMAKARVFHT